MELTQDQINLLRRGGLWTDPVTTTSKLDVQAAVLASIAASKYNGLNVTRGGYVMTKLAEALDVDKPTLSKALLAMLKSGKLRTKLGYNLNPNLKHNGQTQAQCTRQGMAPVEAADAKKQAQAYIQLWASR
jgi:hypothetical protein